MVRGWDKKETMNFSKPKKKIGMFWKPIGVVVLDNNYFMLVCSIESIPIYSQENGFFYFL